MPPMSKYYIHTYGCAMNYSDTERMETYIEALGYDKATTDSEADLVIFNTCSIRQKAEDRVIGQVRQTAFNRQNQSRQLIAVTGCMVRQSSSRYSSERDQLFNVMRDLDIALRIEELPRLASLMREVCPEIAIQAVEEELLEDYFKISASYTSTSTSQAFIPVSTGCDKFCTYCIVPYSRGREKSRKLEDILQEAKELVAEGYKEITLIGQTVDSYGLSRYDKEHGTFAHLPDGKLPFVYLLEQLDLLHESGLARVRFTSPHPSDMSDQLIQAITTLRTQMPYLHLPVQAGHNQTLKRMNRNYTREDYIDIIRRVRKQNPDIAISTDVIVGFCGETEEEFEATYKLFEELEFDHAYIAQYSERRGTTAGRFMQDDVAPEVKKQRWNRLNDLLRQHSKKKLAQFQDKTIKVLVEGREKGGIMTGRSEHFKTIRFSGSDELIGQIVPVKITKTMEWILEGELVGS